MFALQKVRYRSLAETLYRCSIAEMPCGSRSRAISARTGCSLLPAARASRLPVDGEGVIVEEGVRRSPAARAVYVTLYLTSTRWA
jgi:hypothetical protein